MKSVSKHVAIAAMALLPTTALADWSGAYGGLGFGSVTGDLDFFDGDVEQALDDGTTISGFAGYQIQRNDFVYGGEISLTSPSDVNVTGFDTAEISDLVIDLKARGGYAAGDFLFYGVLGLSTGTYINDINNPNDEWDLTGFNYGVGVDYDISSQFNVGAEYLLRDLEGDDPSGGSQTVQVDFDTLSLRASYRF